MRNKIVIILGCVFFTGFYAGAEQIQNSAVQKDTVSQSNSAVQKDTTSQSNSAVQKDTVSQSNSAVQKDTVSQSNSAVQKDTTSQPNSAAQKDTTSQMDLSPKTDTSVFQMAEVEVDKPRRNGFATLYLSPFYSFDFRELGLNISTGYGVMFGGSAIAPAGIFEGRLGVNGGFFKGAWAVAFNIGKEINFVKNDGINKLIPGVRLNLGVGYIDNSRDRYYIMPNVGSPVINNNSPPKAVNLSSRINPNKIDVFVGLEAYLKAFVSKQFALVPSLGVSYRRNPGARASEAELNLDIELGLRQYF